MSEARQRQIMVSVRMTSAERDTLKRAAARQVEGIPGARLSMASFLLQAGLAAAAEMARARGLKEDHR